MVISIDSTTYLSISFYRQPAACCASAVEVMQREVIAPFQTGRVKLVPKDLTCVALSLSLMGTGITILSSTVFEVNGKLMWLATKAGGPIPKQR